MRYPRDLFELRLISHRFVLDDYQSAYNILSDRLPSLGILFDYPNYDSSISSTVLLRSSTALSSPRLPSEPVLGVVGVGNYSSRILIPSFIKAGASLHSLASPSGLAPTLVGKRFNFISATSDVTSLINDSQLNTLVIASRHDSHASLVISALTSKKMYLSKNHYVSLLKS